MRASILVGSNGVERIVSVGDGPGAVEGTLRLLDLIWPEVLDFHVAVACKMRDGIATRDAPDTDGRLRHREQNK